MFSIMLNVFFSILRAIADVLYAIYRDIKGILLVIKLETKMKQFDRKDCVVADLFRQCVKSHPNKPCILFNETVWTFQDMEDYSNRIANLFAKKFKLKKGDSVALLLDNNPQYVGIWLGLSKLGVISALVNINLRNEHLIHSITVAKPKCVIYGADYEDAIESIKAQIPKSIDLIVEESNKENCLNNLLKNQSTNIISPSEKLGSKDIIMYVYTSGTTGLPKPAIIRQSRYLAGGFSFFKSAGLSKEDVIYITLPIYHANGAIIGIGSSLINGATIALRKKFSASNFWKDAIKYNCTCFIYVGEICRFLVNQPPSSLDLQHPIRVGIGNGLRENVWKDFSKRFNIKCMEFYAASEGNCTMINIVHKIGSCGFTPLINKIFKILPVYLIKIDNEMNPIRDKNGYCIECSPGEKGLLIGMIGKSAKTSYNGYANNNDASNKKIIENVFKKGQKAFNSGDLMMCDYLGYMYFCDRLGDTFRWRGENVSTVEVENVISKHLNSKEVVVYGVEVAGQEGRAGMASIKNCNNIDLNKLSQELKLDLPAYARPLFIRFVDEIEHTGTFKARKIKLVEESYNITLMKDKCYYFDNKEQTYKELTRKIYGKI